MMQCFPAKESFANHKYGLKTIHDLKTIEIEFANLNNADKIEQLFTLIFGMDDENCNGNSNVDGNTYTLDGGDIELDINVDGAKNEQKKKKKLKCNIENLYLRRCPFNTHVCLTIFDFLKRLTFPKLKQLRIETSASTKELQFFDQCLQILNQIKMDTEKHRSEKLCIYLRTKDGTRFAFIK